MRILGIDPGSVHTGFALVDIVGQRMHCVRAQRWSLRGDTMGARLLQLHESVQALISECQPDVAALETVFVHHNPSSALKLGQARGVILCALAQHALAVHEYSPATIKQTVCGNGRASKEQVGWMITRLLNLRETPLSADAADAAAVAVCHFQHEPARNYRLAAP